MRSFLLKSCFDTAIVSIYYCYFTFLSPYSDVRYSYQEVSLPVADLGERQPRVGANLIKLATFSQKLREIEKKLDCRGEGNTRSANIYTASYSFSFITLLSVQM